MIAADLFAGAGGSSIGAEAAGARVVLAANHWRAAIDTHKANHPHTEHWLQDLQQADFRRLPAHDLLLASPSCVGQLVFMSFPASYHMPRDRRLATHLLGNAVCSKVMTTLVHAIREVA